MTTKSSQAGRVLRLSILAASIGLAMVPQMSHAQSAEGALYGQAKAGTVITVVNIETGQTRKESVPSGGTFRIAKLPPGRYKVTADGVTREVEVTVGGATEVKLAAAQLETVTVSGRRVRTIDLTTAETSTVFTAEQIRELPVGRSVDSVAQLAAGVVKGDPGLGNGNLPSFSGASVAENGYYINGFDVTNIRTFLSYAQLPFEAIGVQQVKSGGYGAEYGRSLGGVISLVTKRGTNDWKGGASLSWTPGELASRGKDTYNMDPATVNANGQRAYRIYQSNNYFNSANANFYVGGPIIKDKLFIFGLVEAPYSKSETYGAQTTSLSDSHKPRTLVKVDFQPFDNHTFEYTGINNKSSTDIIDYTDKANGWYTVPKTGTPGLSQVTSGGTVNILKYTGSLTDSLTVSALAGQVRYQNARLTGARLDGADCPTVYEVGATKALGCWNGIFPGAPGRDPKAPLTDDDNRDAYRLDLEYTLGNHTIRAGLDNQKFESSQAGGSSYSGGMYWRYFVSTGTVNGTAVPAGTPVVRKRTYLSTSGVFEVENKAWYVEDSWQVTRNLLVYGGLRGESFDNKNSDGVSFVKKDNLLAPRLGFSLNANGDGQTKVYGTFGRYYIPVASNTNIRATRAEGSSESWYTYTGRDPVTGAPLGTNKVGGTIGSENLILPDPATVSDTNLKPMSQDELILGLQKALSKSLVIGVKGSYRKINNGMDDFCGFYALKNWATDNGFPNYKGSNLGTNPCLLMNPGNDATVKLDLNNDGKLTTVTIPARYFGLEKYQRTYRALEFTAEHPWDGKWGGSLSYVWSKSRGTAEGYVQSTLQQEDAGATQDFDYGSFTHGSYGYLPNDRRHVFKAFGNFAVTDTFKIGGNAILSSGRPLSCIGYVPSTVADYNKVDGKYGSGDYTSASSYYCLNDQGKSVLVPRGTAGRTPWTYQFDLQFAYSPKLPSGKLTLQANIYNILNSQKVTRQSEIRDYSRAEARLNPNYGQPDAFQSPRSVNLSARYEF